MQSPISTTKQDILLIEAARRLLRENYKSGQHHVGCVIATKKSQYTALHLDSEGFDVCAEPIALSRALYSNDTEFVTLVSVGLDATGNIDVIPPCGNCRQILLQYAPQVFVILKQDSGYTKVQAKHLLPYPYYKS